MFNDTYMFPQSQGFLNKGKILRFETTHKTYKTFVVRICHNKHVCALSILKTKIREAFRIWKIIFLFRPSPDGVLTDKYGTRKPHSSNNL